MSEQPHLDVLDQISTIANGSIEAYQRGSEALDAAKAGTDALVELLNTAGGAITTSQTQAERDAASINNAVEHTGQAYSLHVSLEFPDGAEAKTAQSQLAEAARLLGRVARGYIHLQQQLSHGIGAEINKHRQAILRDAFGSIGLGQMQVRFNGIASQRAIIDASEAYKQRRIDEARDVKAGQQLLETAKTTLTPVEEEATTEAEKKPTPQSIIAELDDVVKNLRPMGPILANFPASAQALQQLYEDAGTILMSWTTAPEAVKAKHESIGRALADLVLPIGAEAINEHVGKITASKNSIESAKNEVEISKGFVKWGREFIGKTISLLGKYVRRRS